MLIKISMITNTCEGCVQSMLQISQVRCLANNSSPFSSVSRFLTQCSNTHSDKIALHVKLPLLPQTSCSSDFPER